MISESDSLSVIAAHPGLWPAPPPGLHRHVHFADYLRWPLMSQSTLKRGRESMAHLKAAYDGVSRLEATDDMILGSCVHVAFLEPELVARKVVLWDGGRRYGAKWDEFCAEHEGRYILTPDAYEKMVGMVRAIRAHPWIRSVLGTVTDTEVSCVGSINGVPMKGRADALCEGGLMLDIKKVRSGDSRMFTNQVLQLGYHIQDFTYSRLFNRDRMVLVTVEDAPPYDVVPYELSPSFRRIGEREAIALLDQWKFANREGKFPGRSDDPVTLDAPEWAMEGGYGITLDGGTIEE